MPSGIASLHKILKDETRQKILILVNKKGSASYTELLNSIEHISTGLLNYHLKVLGDLLAKNSEGQYMLSETGKLAFSLLTEFPAENQLQHRRIWQRRFFIGIAISQVAYFAVALTFYFLGYINLYRLTTATIAVIMVPFLFILCGECDWMLTQCRVHLKCRNA